MKKLISMLAIFAILMVGAMSIVNAATSETLADDLYVLGKKYGVTEAERVKIERYLSEYPLSNSDCDKILELAQEADEIMKAHNSVDYKDLPVDVKSKLRSLAIEAANIAGVTLDFKSDRIDVYKDGKLLESFSRERIGKLVYTGNNSIVLVVSSIAVIALVAVAARKKLAND